MALIAGIKCLARGGSYMPLAEEMCTGYDPDTPGTQTVTITYGSYTAAIDVEVVE